MKDIILKYVLQNSVKYGKADAGAVVGKILNENPKLKSKVKDVMKEINDVINKTSSWSLEKKTDKLL